MHIVLYPWLAVGSALGLVAMMLPLSWFGLIAQDRLHLSRLGVHVLVLVTSLLLVALWLLVLVWLGPLLAPSAVPCGAPHSPPCVTL